MKLKRKNPCRECPFRKTAPKRWLGPWNTDEILRQVHSEVGLACHMDSKIKKGLPDDELHETVHVCVGSLQHANASCKRYRDPALSKMQTEVGTSDSILGLLEFKKHHEGDE